MAYYNRAVLRKKIDSNLAISDYEKAIDINPHYAKAHNGLGLMKAKTSPEEAIECYTKAIELNENYVNAYKNRAKCYAKLAESETDAAKKQEYEKKANEDADKVKAIEQKNKNVCGDEE